MSLEKLFDLPHRYLPPKRRLTAILPTLALIMLELQFFQANVFNHCKNKFEKAICYPTPLSLMLNIKNFLSNVFN